MYRIALLARGHFATQCVARILPGNVVGDWVQRLVMFDMVSVLCQFLGFAMVECHGTSALLGFRFAPFRSAPLGSSRFVLLRFPVSLRFLVSARLGSDQG